MSVTVKVPEISVRKKLAELEGIDLQELDERYLKLSGSLQESPTVSIPGTITAFRQGNLVTVNGSFSGWASGVIAVLSEEFRPIVDQLVQGITISTAGSITPSSSSVDGFTISYEGA